MSRERAVKTAPRVAELLGEIRERAVKLLTLYEQIPALNEVQPSEMAQALPCSLDEWVDVLGDAIDKWRALRGTDIDALVKAFQERYLEVNDWHFEYMYPGYFTYYNGQIRVFFTPDFNTKGAVDIQASTDAGDVIEVDNPHDPVIPYTAPLTAEALLEIVRPYLKKFGTT